MWSYVVNWLQRSTFIQHPADVRAHQPACVLQVLKPVLLLEPPQFLTKCFQSGFIPAAVNALALSFDLCATLHSIRVQADVAPLLPTELKQFLANLSTVAGIQLQGNLSLLTFETQPVCQKPAQGLLTDVSSGTPQKRGLVSTMMDPPAVKSFILQKWQQPPQNWTMFLPKFQLYAICIWAYFHIPFSVKETAKVLPGDTEVVWNRVCRLKFFQLASS